MMKQNYTRALISFEVFKLRHEFNIRYCILESSNSNPKSDSWCVSWFYSFCP